MISWIQHRIAEPSTWAAVGAGLVGIGVIITQPTVLIVGVAIAALGLIMKENGGS
jgi:fumarate reductase subunit D